MTGDRCDGYIPDGLYRHGRMVEIGRRWTGEAYEPILGELAHGLADENNREARWEWALCPQPSDDGPVDHWSHFTGHRVQVDVELHTFNERVVNDWKGRDEIRRGGQWSVRLNHHLAASGEMSDPFEMLLKLRTVIRRLLDSPVDWSAGGVEQLEGRRVYWRDTPAVVQRAIEGGRLVLVPDGVDQFPPPPAWMDDPEGWDGEEAIVDLWEAGGEEAIVDLWEAGNVWWWRKQGDVVTVVDDVIG